MRLQTKPCRTLFAIVVASLAAPLFAPGMARAQSLDDPGLGAPPPPPPPPAERPANLPPRPAAQPNLAPAPAAVAPASAPIGTPVLVKEEVTEDTKVIRNGGSDDVWEAQLAAPSLVGAVGLFRVMTAETGKPASFRASLHLQGFTQNSFIIAGGSNGTGDTDSRFLGDLAVSFAGPDVTFLRHLELYFGIFNSSNQNNRTDSGRTDPAVILALADVGVGLKAAYEFARGFSLGANLGFRFLNSISGDTANFNATQIDFNLLAMLDIRKYKSNVPLRFHLNLGYIVDNSLKLLPDGQCASSTGSDSCIRSRVVETFAYGINDSRFRMGLAADVPIRAHYGDGRIFGIEPFFEYHLSVATGDGDTTVRDKLIEQRNTDIASTGTSSLSLDRINNQLSQWVTIGLRLRPIVGLVIDLGLDLRLQNPGYEYGPPIPEWNVIAGLGYAYDFSSGTNSKVTRTVTRTYEVNRRPPEGHLAGTVFDVKTNKPIMGAVVKYAGANVTAQSTDEKGQFTSYGLPAGPVQMQITDPDYEPVAGNPTVRAEETRSIRIGMKPLPPKEGKVRIKVLDEKNLALPGANGKIACGTVLRDATFDGDLLVVMAPAGECTVSVEANGFLSKDRQVTVAPASDQTVEVILTKRPKTSHVEVTKDAIIIKGTIHFATNEATILPDGLQILNEVVDVLSKSPQIRHVSIEGHTDDKGNADKNLQLSKDRAKAVVDYMVKNGIHPDRLTSAGYGQEKPLVPNNSSSNRAKNRRVEFRILDQSAPIMN